MFEQRRQTYDDGRVLVHLVCPHGDLRAEIVIRPGELVEDLVQLLAEAHRQHTETARRDQKQRDE